MGFSSSPPSPDRVSRPTQPPIPWVKGALSLGVKRLGREANRSLPSSAEVKNAWSYTSTLPVCLHGVVLSLKKKAQGQLYFLDLSEMTLEFRNFVTFQTGTFHADFVDTYVIYLCTKFHTPSSNIPHYLSPLNRKRNVDLVRPPCWCLQSTK